MFHILGTKDLVWCHMMSMLETFFPPIKLFNLLSMWLFFTYFYSSSFKYSFSIGLQYLSSLQHYLLVPASHPFHIKSSYFHYTLAPYYIIFCFSFFVISATFPWPLIGYLNSGYFDSNIHI